jgi:hypothetical protein
LFFKIGNFPPTLTRVPCTMYDVRCAPDDDDDTHPLFFPAHIPHIYNLLVVLLEYDSHSPRVPRFALCLLWLTTRVTARVTTARVTMVFKSERRM